MATRPRTRTTSRSSGPKGSSEDKHSVESAGMASSTGDSVVRHSEDAFLLQSRELPSMRLVGKGLCGIVYETTWNGVRHARKDFVEVPSAVFRLEALVLLHLEGHKNIVKTYGYTVDKRSCSLVLEYMDDDLVSFLQKRKELKQKLRGKASEADHLIDPQDFIESRKNSNVPGNLSDLSTCLPPLQLPEAVDIMLEMATGMAYLHENGIPHGDLKPRNILVTLSNGTEKLVKVADFGLHRSKSQSMYFVSRRARVLDMAQWKAPEYLEMCNLDKKTLESDLDEDEEMAIPVGSFDWLCRADVYSFALTSFQILTGEIPFPIHKWESESAVDNIGFETRLKPELPTIFQLGLLGKLMKSCWGDTVERPDFSAICKQLGEIKASLIPIVFQSTLTPIISKRKQRELNFIIQMPRRKRRKMALAASTSRKPGEILVLDSRSEDPMISDYTINPPSEIESNINLVESQASQPSTQRKSMEVTDSSLSKPVERPRLPDSVLDEGFLELEDDSINSIQKQRELDAAAAPESWAPPEFAQYTSSPIKKRVSRAFKRCITVTKDALKHSEDHMFPDIRGPELHSPFPGIISSPERSHFPHHHELGDAPESWAPPEFAQYTSSPIKKRVSRAFKRCITVTEDALKHSEDHMFPDLRGPDLLFPGETPFPGIISSPERSHFPYHHELGDGKIGNLGLETTSSEKGWKKAFVRIPSKIQHWAANSIQFCKLSKSIENYEFPGDYRFSSED
ncbi:hypothetical protein KC19_12G032400 [Ceratodon purpureus]|uniref:Protein kinase domain-containing protein n=1 Tax=Ceratodon purpureus TaxID=3225 RepID=A0A8T0G8U3_CERPU|nr:hypothetical protein KC19_12G032400 [Ceratodon purpureus]